MNKNLPVAEACLRNQEPITQVLQNIFAETKTVLEIGSGTGQHAVFLGKQMPRLIWQPSEMPERVIEVEAWREAENLANILECKSINVLQSDWHLNNQYDGVFTANTVHYISWEKVEALLKGTSLHIMSGGKFVVYGPFNKDQQYTSEGNKNLDQWLKSKDASSGIKDIEDFVTLAKKYHFKLVESIEMPANNLMLYFTFLEKKVLG